VKSRSSAGQLVFFRLQGRNQQVRIKGGKETRSNFFTEKKRSASDKRGKSITNGGGKTGPQGRVWRGHNKTFGGGGG